MKPDFVVIGLGRFGLHLARSLVQSGADVLAVDIDRQIIERVRDSVTFAVRLDSTNEEALRSQGIDQASAVICGIGSDFEAAVLTVSILKSFDIPDIICRVDSDRRGKILTQVGATAIVNPEADAAIRWSHRLSLPPLSEYLELGEGHSIVQMVAPPTFLHKTPQELELRQRFDINLVAIRRVVTVHADRQQVATTTQTTCIPGGDTKILPNDMLVLVGSNESINRVVSQ